MAGAGGRDGAASGRRDHRASVHPRRVLGRGGAGAPVAAPPPPVTVETRQPGRETARRARRNAADTARALAQLEATLEAREGRKVEVEAMLADPNTYRNPDLAAELLAEHAGLETEIDTLLEQWSELSEAAD